jgi:hypothetical protein
MILHHTNWRLLIRKGDERQQLWGCLVVRGTRLVGILNVAWPDGRAHAIPRALACTCLSSCVLMSVLTRYSPNSRIRWAQPFLISFVFVVD